jgi:regulatory protein
MELQKNKMHNEQYKKACRIAYRLLTYRDRTEYEINKKLKEKGFEPNIINEVIEHLRENDFINDQKYVKRFIAESKFCSRAKIWGKLRNLGIKNSMIENALDEAGPDFEYQAALSLVLKKINLTEESMSKIVSYLKNRGFCHNTVERVCNYLETRQDVDNLDSKDFKM